jgi:hypothetical protein
MENGSSSPQAEKGFRINAKNFLITYPEEVPSKEILPKLSNVFKNSQISEKKLEQGQKEFLVTLGKKKNLTSTKKLRWRAFTPVVRPVVEGDKFLHCKETSNQGITEALEKFLLDPNEEDKKIFRELLFSEMENINTVIYSEYLLSSIMNSYLVRVGQKRKWQDYRMFSIDSKIEMVKEGQLMNFRADTVIIFKEALIVFEFKYKFDRLADMGKLALQCLKKRKYGNLVFDHIRRYYPSISKNISKILEVGLGYCIKKQHLNLSLYYNYFNLIEIDV